jgi:hypothetical protein
MTRKTITEQDYIKACKRGDREREISTHGKIISTRPSKVHSPKNEYKRSKNKKINLDIYE